GALLQMRSFLAGYNYTPAFWYSLCLIVALCLVEWLDERRAVASWLPAWPRAGRWSVYYAGMALLVVLGQCGAAELVYMRFCGEAMADNTAVPEAAAGIERARPFWKTALVFTLIGLALYLVLLAIAEMRVRATGERNPFFQIATAAPGESDVVILGASHAMPLGFEGIGTLLKERSGRDVMVLAIEGGGVVPNALLLDALLRKTEPRTIV